jgi:hypothetical protein
MPDGALDLGELDVLARGGRKLARDEARRQEGDRPTAKPKSAPRTA